ncbi:MAG: ATP-binding protein [Haloarculaceae archaeon]
MHVIGRDGGDGPVGHLGHYRARDGSAGERVGVDLDGPHVVTIVGKRGSGKSYTLGVLAEALARTGGIAPVIADPMGVFGTLAADELADQPIDGDPVRAHVHSPSVAAGAIEPDAWCRLLGLDPAGGPGTLVWRAAAAADSLSAMQAFVADADASDRIRRAAANHLRLAASWGVFADGERGAGPDQRPLGDDATVLELAGLGRAPMNAAVAATARRCYDARVADRLDRLPWLLVDEAHAFFDGVAGPALRTVLTRGRQPGVSLVVATQRPSALPDVVVSQTDLLVVHRLTSQTDRESLTAARQSFVTESLTARMPTEPGQALVIDDATESVHPVQVRERHTPHGGASPRVSDVAGGGP